MARKVSMLDNPLGLVTKRYPACRVKGGERTHIYDARSGGSLCGAGLHRNGEQIDGAVIRSGKKVARGEIDCLRCIKILKLDPELTGKPTTVEYAGGKPKRSKTRAIVLRKFKPSAEGKRKEHVMVVGGRAGAYIAKRQPKDQKSYRRSKDQMSVWETKRAYIPAEVTTFGPAYITAYEPDGTPARHKFRRGSDKHPTQTKLARKPWLTRQPGSAAPRPVVRRPAREEIAVVANPRRNGQRMDVLQEMAHKAGYLVATYSPGDGVTRYRFFDLDEMARKGVSAREQDYFGPLNGKHTALGRAKAKKWVESQAKPHRTNSRRANPSVSFKTADGRTVSFKTKAKKR